MSSSITNKHLTMTKTWTICRQHLSADHYSDVIKSAAVSQITGVSIVFSIMYSGADHQTSKFCVTSLFPGNPPVSDAFFSPKSTNAKIFRHTITSVSIHQICFWIGANSLKQVTEYKISFYFFIWLSKRILCCMQRPIRSTKAIL